MALKESRASSLQTIFIPLILRNLLISKDFILFPVGVWQVECRHSTVRRKRLLPFLFSSVVRCIMVVCVPTVGKVEGPACGSYFDPLTVSDGKRQGCVMFVFAWESDDWRT